MLKVKDRTESYIRWIVGKGEVDFWKDRWWGEEKLGDLVDVSSSLSVREAVTNFTWKDQVCSILNANEIMKIQSMGEVINSEADRSVWAVNACGNFSLKSAWEGIRIKKNVAGSLRFIWHPCTPLKLSFLSWRMLHKRLPVDDYLIRMGFQLASKCNCCSQPQIETVEHIFVTSLTAKTVWVYFEDILGIQTTGSSIHTKITAWWLCKFRSPCHKAVIVVFFNSICWEIWLSRNRWRYENQTKRAAHRSLLMCKTLFMPL